MNNSKTTLPSITAFLPLPRPAKSHRLYEIDLERRIAFCTVCGYTEIHIRKSRTQGTPKVICVKRFEQKKQERRARLLEAKRQKAAESVGSTARPDL